MDPETIKALLALGPIAVSFAALLVIWNKIVAPELLAAREERRVFATAADVCRSAAQTTLEAARTLERIAQRMTPGPVPDVLPVQSKPEGPPR